MSTVSAFAAAMVLCVAHVSGCTVSSQRVECGSQTCDPVTSQCTACTNSSQCFESVMQCVDGECRVGSVRDTITAETLVSMVFTVVVCGVAVVAGIGGGGILVPMYAALTEMPMITAVGLSQAAICGQSAFNMCFVIRKRMSVNNDESRLLINYQYLAVLLPLSLLGTLLGSALSKIVPDWLRLALLFALLTTVLHRVIERAKRQFKTDKLEKHPEGEKEQTGGTDAKVPASFDQSSPETRALRVPSRELVVISLAFASLLLFNVLRTGFTSCGSTAYFVLFFMPVVMLTLLALLGRKMTSVTFANIVAGYLPADHLTFQWNYNTTVIFPLVAVVAGGAASMLGIGGGLVLSFVLYEAGLAPEEASATSAFATLVIASESALQLIFQGQLVADYAVLYFSCGIVSTLLGQFVFMRNIRQYKANYLIVVALALIVGGSLVTLTSYGIYDMVELLRHDGSLLAFGHFCKQL